MISADLDLTNDLVGEENYRIKIGICNKSVECVLTRWKEDGNNVIDLIPILNTFENLEEFNPYVDLNLESINLNSDFDVNKIVKNINQLITKKYSNKAPAYSSYVELSFEMIGQENLENSIIWEWHEGSKHYLLIEFPICSKKNLNNSNDIEYFLDILPHNQPNFCITFEKHKESFELGINPGMYKNLTKYLEIPKITHEKLLGDVLDKVRLQFLSNWTKKKIFIEQLCEICCVTEFNAIDFSFASILIRLKFKKLFTLFLVNIRIVNKFPSNPPVITIYDLQSSSIILVDSSELVWNHEADSVPLLARKTIIFICNLMNRRAFPEKYL